MQPTLALAIEDYVPVLLSFLALWWLVRMALAMHRPSGLLALAGLALIVLGGALKASAKLVGVVGGPSVAWMENSLFPLMAPGFICFGWALRCGQQCLCEGEQPRRIWVLPAIVIVLALGSMSWLALAGPGRAWFFVALTLVVLASSISVILLMRQCWRQGLRAVGILLGVYLLITLALNGMARRPSDSLTTEWIKQGVNTLAAAIFALSAWLLSRQTLRMLSRGAAVAKMDTERG